MDFLDDEATPEEQRAAMIQAMRARMGIGAPAQPQAADFYRGQGNLALQSGDRVLGGFGQAQLGQAQQLGSQAADGKRYAFSQLLQAQRDAAHRKEQLADTASQRRWQDGRDAASQAAAMERARIMAGEKRAEKTAVDVERDVENLSKRLEGAPAMRQDLSTLTQAAKQEDIPGVGPIAGWLPDWMVSADGKKVRQAMRGVVRSTIHETSGTAASEGEVERIMGELGFKEGGGEDAWRMGLEGVAEKTKALLRTKEAGYLPEAVKVARQRGMVTSEDVPTYRAPGAAGGEAADPDAAPAGMKWQKNKKTGERRLVPAGG